ncbi:MAG: hypothetical protein PWP24_231 [Clostridiales bacterium]|nr:hypothetical protein [Clostridiales bacterium]
MPHVLDFCPMQSIRRLKNKNGGDNLNQLDYKGWSIHATKEMQTHKKYYESIFSQGNGYMGIRGTLPEDASNQSFERCTYIAGVFEYIKEQITDMVNVPDFMATKLMVGDEIFDPLSKAVEISEQSLHLDDGTLRRSYLWKTDSYGRVSIKSERFLSIENVHTAAIRYQIKLLDQEAPVLFSTGIYTGASNQPIADDQLKQNDEVLKLTACMERIQKEGCCLRFKTTGKAAIEIAEGFLVVTNQSEPVVKEEVHHPEQYYGYSGYQVAKRGEELIFDKLISVFTSRECEPHQLMEQTMAQIKQNKELGYPMLYQKNKMAWEEKWRDADVILEGDLRLQTAIRYNLFQLIQTNAQNDSTVNIGARGITHGRYKGCYFWDTDIFMLPFFVHTNPLAAKNLLLYRYQSLPDARENAKELNLSGARFPWMCSIDGREQCESWDIGKSEIHVTADVVYAMDYYVRMTQDMEFYQNCAIETYIEAARYHVSRLTYESKTDQYNLLFVKGPDEYCGITSNNTYTNWLIRYNFLLALQGISYLKEHNQDQYDRLWKKLNLSEQEVEKWDEIKDKIVLPYDSEKQLYLQDDTFFKLEPLDIAAHKKDGVPLYHSICFDRLQRYQVLKQADLVLLVTLLPKAFTDEQKRAIWNFYEPKTLHDSSLSCGVHANLAANLSMEREAVEYFKKSIMLDLEDTMENTGREGLHVAAFGASYQALIMGFAGVIAGEEGLEVHPHLPKEWTRLAFTVAYQKKRYEITITAEKTEIKSSNFIDK